MILRLNPKLILIAALGVFVLALGLRMYELGEKEYWLDEVLEVGPVLESTSAEDLISRVIRRRGENPPLSHLTRYAASWIAVDEFHLRLPSMLFGFLTVLVVFEFGRRLVGLRVGLIASLVLAVSAYHVEYSQEARPYAAFGFLAAVSLLCGAGLVRSGRRPWWTWPGFILATALLPATHALGLVVIVANLLVMLVSARNCCPTESARHWWSAPVVATMLALLLASPVLWLMLGQVGEQASAGLPGPELNAKLFLGALHDLSGGSWIWLLVSTGSITYALTRGDGRSRRLVAGGLLWIGVVFAGVLAALSLGHRFFHVRYLIPLAPMLALVTAVGVVVVVGHMSGKWKRFGLPFVAVIALGSQSTGLHHYFSTPKRPWRSILAHLREHVSSNAVVLVDPPYLAFSLMFHLGAREPKGMQPSQVTLAGKNVTVGPALLLQNAEQATESREVWYLVDRGWLELDQRGRELPAWVRHNLRLDVRFGGLVGELEVHTNAQR